MAHKRPWYYSLVRERSLEYGLGETVMPLDYDALLLDLSGVLYEGSQVIAGAARIVDEARQKGLTLRFVTNTASKSAATINADLRRMQIDVRDGELFTAPMAAKAYLKQHQWRPYCLVHAAIQPEFSDIDQRSPNCVLLGDAGDELTYANLNKAFALCKQGAALIGIGMNKYFKDDGGLKLDAGAFIHAIAWAADVQPIIMGKPSRDFFELVVASTGFSAERCLMIGDDVISDVVGAIDAGLQGCLVRTGKFIDGDELHLPAAAFCIDSIRDLFSRRAR